ncbi:hypothetical protein IEO21_03385 [Rhodonia placenta]|uniref:BTB domain-containing protein n=1 Tax=Rhodonia placenta TaxID=104341 RepID=A0A8H7U3L1_9APHY|nr:hypothetical protein IEO21_03385 [Postia placenta]
MATPHAASPARGPTPADLQSHLYQSFLTRKTADVALRVRGSWHAIYKLHRVILIQAGFFQSLFTSGFVESKAKLASSRRPEPDVIDIIVFDDPNITRADNTRVCIARLYGGGPPLHVPSSLLPTPSQPLTPAFPYPSSAPSSPTPDGHHRATPRFLLSLLATSLFLSMPAVASEALQMILSTVGPYTAVRYLNFALGHGIGPPDNDEPGDGHEPAVGLESVAELALAMRAEPTTPDSGSSQEDQICKEGPASAASDDSGSDMDLGTDDYDGESRRAPEPAYVYGAVSNKIGEAAACWLGRWGADILHWEEDVTRGHARSKSEDQGGGRKRTSTAPSRFAEPARNGGVVGGADTREMVVPVVWRSGGLDARWVRGLLSSDALFVRGERERYEMAKTVVEMRRKEGIDEEEEKEWEALFRTGIYYENMILDDVIAISRDASPSTGQHFVPLSVLQASHWSQDVLRHRITARPASGPLLPPLSPSQRDKELGIGLSASDVASLVAQERDTYEWLREAGGVRVHEDSARASKEVPSGRERWMNDRAYIESETTCKATMFVTKATMFVTKATMFVTNATMFVTKATMFVTKATMFVTKATMFVTKATMFVTRCKATMFVTRRKTGHKYWCSRDVKCSSQAMFMHSSDIIPAITHYSGIPKGKPGATVRLINQYISYLCPMSRSDLR